MRRVELLSGAIKESIELKGSSVFKNSKIFCAIMDDLVPRLEKERNIFRRVLDNRILTEIGRLYDDISNQEEQNRFWSRLKKTIMYDYGFREEWCDIVIESFVDALNSVEPAKLFQKAEKGDINALIRLYEILPRLCKETEREQLFRLLEKAAEQGNDEAQYILAKMYRYGKGTEKNERKALEWYEKAAEQGNSDAQFDLGSIYRTGNSVGLRAIEKNNEKSVTWYKKAAELGSAKAQRVLGNMYMKGERIEKDYKKAMEWYIKAAEGEDEYIARECQAWIGYMYYSGKGAEKNAEEALEWYKKSVDGYDGLLFGGVIHSVIVYMYEEGETKRDIKKALELYERAAEKGHAQVQINVAQLYDGIDDYMNTTTTLRKVIDRDPKKAMEWLKKAAAQGDVVALSTIGDKYYFGIGVEKDYAMAFLFCEKAAEKGSFSDLMRLAEMYEKGVGVRRNIEAALYWYRKAAERGADDAEKKLKEYDAQ